MVVVVVVIVIVVKVVNIGKLSEAPQVSSTNQQMTTSRLMHSAKTMGVAWLWFCESQP